MALVIGAAVALMGAGLFLMRLTEVRQVRQKAGLEITNPGGVRLRIAYELNGVRQSFETTTSTNLDFNPHTLHLTLDRLGGSAPVEVATSFGGHRLRRPSVWTGRETIIMELATTVDWPKFWSVTEYDASAVAKKSLHVRGLPPPPLP